MSRRSSQNNSQIIPAAFDLAIIEVVEYLYSQGEKLQEIIDKVPDKKDILTDIGISHLIWPQMVNHYRHVSTKSLKQQEIVSHLKKKYFVNPAFIWKYPNEKKMFLVDDLFAVVAEDDVMYNMPGSAKLLKKELLRVQKELDKALTLIQEKNKIIKSLNEDISNLKMLVLELKKSK